MAHTPIAPAIAPFNPFTSNFSLPKLFCMSPSSKYPVLDFPHWKNVTAAREALTIATFAMVDCSV
jgi:hypothetical protein